MAKKKLYYFVDIVVGTCVYFLCTTQNLLILLDVLGLLFSFILYEENREACIYISSI